MSEEDDKARRDRELRELLEELRLILPGVEVLFAFLLSLPFTQRFAAVTGLQRDAYFVAFLCSAGATALLIAPSAHHRLLWHRRPAAKEAGLATAARLALAGLALLALAVTCVVFLVTDVLFGGAASAGIATALGGVVVWLWFGWPLSRRLRDRATDRRDER